MPLPWSAYAAARTAGLLLVAALAGSSLTNAVASHFLVSDDALVAVPGLVDRSTVPESEPDEDPSSTDPKDRARGEQLAAALASQVEVEAKRSTEFVVEHNVFCPACQPAPVELIEPTKPTLTPTDLPLALVATMESDDPQASLATIRDTERRATGVFGVGDPIRPGVVVAGVQRGRVVLRCSDGMQTLDFAGAPEPKAKPKPKSPSKPGSREIPGAREAIDCKGNACTVDRKFVDELMKNPRLLTRQAKLVPAVEDGETRGFRVHRVRQGTLPRLLGLQNGDTLLAVNGTELDSMDQAISLYTKLRRASELSLTVERKGKVFEKQISIR